METRPESGAADWVPTTEGADEFSRDAPSLNAGLDAVEVVELEWRDVELIVRGAEVALAARPMTACDGETWLDGMR